MNLRRFLGKGKAAWHIMKSEIHPSFSQAGEDMILSFLFNSIGITSPTYIDIGANHPIICNNTFYFYNRGGRGVCIEPDPKYYRMLKRVRTRDVVLHAGVAATNADFKEAVLYTFPDPYSGWNTFSEEEALSRQKESGISIESRLLLPLIHVNDIIKNNFNGSPNLISLDVEGLDLEILKSIDFDSFKPDVFCVETVTFSTSNQEEKLTETIDFVKSQGYFVYADTHINTIFCRNSIYKKMGS